MDSVVVETSVCWIRLSDTLDSTGAFVVSVEGSATSTISRRDTLGSVGDTVVVGGGSVTSVSVDLGG